jgi:hypothetical protein
MPHNTKSIAKVLRIFLIIIAVVVSQTAFISQAFAASFLTLDSFSGTPGSTITVSGGGWPANDPINIYFSAVGSTPATTVTTGADGSFSTSLTIPANAPQGPLPVIGVDASNAQNSNSYYVVPLSISLTSTAASHSPFSLVAVSGTGFIPNEKVTVDLAGSSTVAQADSSGAFSTNITVPPVPSGLYNIRATGQSSGAVSTDYLNFFWIDAFFPSVSPSSYYVLPGQTLAFNGSGFAASETIDITTIGATSTLGTFTADNTGSFTNAGGFVAPFDFAGATKTFTLTGELSHQSASTGVTFGNFFANASPTSYFIFPVQPVAFNGSGFAANETVNVTRTGSPTILTSFVTDQTGSFLNAGSVNAPADSAGSLLSFTLTGASSHASAQVSLSVGSFYPSITPSSYYVQGNSTITLSGTGFAPNETVNITVTGNSNPTQVTATTLGTFSGSVVVPFSSNVSATISAVGNISNSPTSVNVTLAAFFPSIVPSTYFTYPGSLITYSGTGFVPNESVAITSVIAVPSTVFADAQGNFITPTIPVPFSSLSPINTTFTGALSRNPVGSSILVGTLSPYLTADSYSGTPGQTIHVSGFSFAAGETVNVTASNTSTTAVASSTGEVPPVAISIPFKGGTALHVVFTGVSSGATASLDISLGSFFPTLVSDNYFASPGSTINLTASGFAPNESLSVSGNSITPKTVQTNALGTAVFPVNIPFGVLLKTIVINVTGNQSGVTDNISINIAPSLAQVSPSTYFATPGSTVTYTGTGFAPNESVSVTQNGIPAAPIIASPTGTFSSGLAAPFNSTVAHLVFTGAVSGVSLPLDISLAQFHPTIILSTYYAQGGSPLTVTGSGYSANETITLAMEGATFGTTVSDINGVFSFPSSIPFSLAGLKTITALGGQSGALAVTQITVAPVFTSFNLGIYASAPGTTVTMSGSGYLPNEPITITTDRTGSAPVVSVNADSSGNFNTSYTLPLSFAQGNLIITATGLHSFDSKSITFFVTGI